MSGVSVQCVRIYKLAVDNACEATDAGILALHGLEEKARELLAEMKTMDELARQMFVLLFLRFLANFVHHFFPPFFFHHRTSLKEAVIVLEAQVARVART